MLTNNGYPAYWISPGGEIIPVPDYHINVVIREPRTFGLTSAKVDRIHKKHSEPLYTEGNARIEIMTALIKKGWIRLRFVSKEHSWTVQCHKLDDATWLRLSNWAMYAMRNKSAAREMVVNISNEEGTYLIDQLEPMFIGELKSK